VLLDFRRRQANREVSGHKHCWSGACEQAGSGKTCRHTRSLYPWERGSGPRDQSTASARHRCLPARRRPPRGRRRRALLTPSSTPRPSRTRRSPSAGSRLPAGRDQPYRHEPLRPRLRCAAAPPRGAAQSGPREPGRAAGPAGAWPRDRPAAQPAGGSLLGTHQERRPVPGTGPADGIRHRRPPRAARPYPVAARQLSATCRSARAAPNCCSRSSPSGTNTPRSGSGPTFRMNGQQRVRRPAAGRRNRCPGHLQRASSRPAPSPAGCAPAASAARPSPASNATRSR
jgi:hypothetical protein